VGNFNFKIQNFIEDLMLTLQIHHLVRLRKMYVSITPPPPNRQENLSPALGRAADNTADRKPRAYFCIFAPLYVFAF
jgi:hypothetical protein